MLNHVSAKIEAGQTVALVGVTGSGKSTLISLLARLHEPPRGSVFVDGVDVRDIPLATLRGAIGFVPQEPFLFSDSLADNIAFGLAAERLRPHLDAAMQSRGEVSASVRAWVGPQRHWKMTACSAFGPLLPSPGSTRTWPTSRTATRRWWVSAASRCRAARSSARPSRAPSSSIQRILILDDALSAVDTYTEEEILSRLREVMRRRTSIIVSHRISTVRDADQILVLDGGRIVERGSHDELIGRNGLYAELHKKQLLEEELAAS